MNLLQRQAKTATFPRHVAITWDGRVYVYPALPLTLLETASEGTARRDREPLKLFTYCST